MANKQALVVYSGGMDSTTLLYKIVKEYGNENVIALTFNYGSNHNIKEIPMSFKTCHKLKVEQRIIELSSFFKSFKSSLMSGANNIPEGHYKEENMKSTVVPFRNGILLSIAVGVAENENIGDIYYGAHAGDHDIYPDCTKAFRDAMTQASQAGTYNKVAIFAPFNDIDKVGILELGITLGVDYSMTWTCYKGNDEPCGKCGSCVERTEAFIQNRIQDPLYDSISWQEAKEFYKSIKK